MCRNMASKMLIVGETNYMTLKGRKAMEKVCAF